MNKKILAAFLAAVMLFCLAACSAEKKDNETEK